MIRTSYAPDTLAPAPDWRRSGACRTEDPDLFFPKGYEGAPTLCQIEEAKAVCRRCPVRDACLAYALDNHIGDGIFGGLTDQERASIRRRAQRRNLPPETAAAQTEEARQPRRERTLQTIFEDNTRLSGGHLAWTGPRKVGFRGKFYTPKQIAFITGRGRKPEGSSRSACGVSSCVLPTHLTDQADRGCGTRPGYERHHREGTEVCEPCRQANRDADNRLRRTGTTKVAV